MAQFLSAHGFLLRAPWRCSWHRNWLSPEQVIQKRASRKQQGFPGGSAGKKICLQCRRPGFDPCVEKIPWRGNGYPLQYSGLDNSMDCIVHGVTKSWTQLSDFHFISLQETAVLVMIIPDLVSEVTNHHICYILFTKSEPRSPVHTQRKTIFSLKEVKCQRICGFFFFNQSGK